MTTDTKYRDTEMSNFIQRLRDEINCFDRSDKEDVKEVEYLIEEIEIRIKGLIYNHNNRSILPFDF